MREQYIIYVLGWIYMCVIWFVKGVRYIYMFRKCEGRF